MKKECIAMLLAGGQGSRLYVLTGDMGRITAKARGARRKNSRLRSGCQLLCYSELTLFEKNGFYTVNEAEPLEMFMGLRTDIELLSLGSYFAQLLSCISDQDQASPELLSLGLNSLSMPWISCKSPNRW